MYIYIHVCICINTHSNFTCPQLGWVAGFTEAVISWETSRFERRIFHRREMGTTSFDSGRDALKAVAESLGAWNWVFFRATGDVVAVEDLSVVAGGIGSVEEMQSCYEEHPQDAE